MHRIVSRKGIIIICEVLRRVSNYDPFLSRESHILKNLRQKQVQDIGRIVAGQQSRAKTVARREKGLSMK